MRRDKVAEYSFLTYNVQVEKQFKNVYLFTYFRNCFLNQTGPTVEPCGTPALTGCFQKLVFHHYFFHTCLLAVRGARGVQDGVADFYCGGGRCCVSVLEER